MSINYISLIQAGFILLIGYLSAHAVQKGVKKVLMRFDYIKHKLLIQRVSFYSIFFLFFFSALSQLGFSLQILLGAAGIFSVAIGFASQTSASNFISGLFLIIERAITEGDTIIVDGVTGQVISVDLLSTKLKTADNTFVRIPNEMLIKSKMTNLSCFAERRLDLFMMFSYEKNIQKIESLWIAMINKNPLCLSDPPPEFKVESIEQNKVTLLLSVWVSTENYAKLKSMLQQTLIEALVENELSPYVEHLPIPYFDKPSSITTHK